MKKCPGLYIDIGKKTKDLLYKNYAHQPPSHFQYQFVDWNFDVSCRIEQIMPGGSGLKAVFRLIIPSSGKAELGYLHDYFGVTAGIGLRATTSTGFDPVLNFSGVVGNALSSFGTDVGFDLLTRAINKFNAGLSFNSDFLIASLSLNDKLDKIEAALYYKINPVTSTSIAAELNHSLSINSTALTVGAQHALFPFTLVKGRVSTDGKIGVLVQQGFWQKLFIAISGEMDFKATNKTPKLGFSTALWP